jgi:predicted esterase
VLRADGAQDHDAGGGWPVVVHAHGTGGNFRAAIGAGIAGELATAATPMATFTFDGVGHGERRGASTRTPDSLVFNIVNPRAARDNHLQGAVDVMTALRLGDVAALTVPTVGTVQFDDARTYYFGHSQGANVGIPAMAVSPRARR